MEVVKYPKKENWENILRRPNQDLEQLEDLVRNIFEGVKADGDKGVIKFTQQFDKVNLERLQVTESEIKEACDLVEEALKRAISKAKENIERFHSSQMESALPVETMEGVTCWRKSVPIEKVGLYIPGGTAPLFSSVLMLGIPARIAGCQEVVLCTPPDKNGKIHPAILYCADLVGITRIFKVGGIQAIAGLTFGTESIPSVFKIFGPGNQFVTMAKIMAIKEGVAIDMPAGPSEVLVLADKSANPDFIGADLLSQAEHGTDSQVILVTYSPDLVDPVLTAVQQQIEKLPRADIARASLENSKIILVRNESEALELVNDYGPEHLIINVENETFFADGIINAGSVFLGQYTPESAGDYASGTNHTLPTNGFSKSYSGVSLDSFIKKITYQKITRAGLDELGPVIEKMAEGEQLEAHKNAVSIRLKQKQ